MVLETKSVRTEGSGPEAALALEPVDRCPLCGSQDLAALFVVREWVHGLEGRFPEVQCRSCSLVYLAERPAAKSLGRYYPGDAYYSFTTPVRHSLFWRTDPLSRTWYFVKKSVLAHGLGYRHFPGSPVVAWLVALPFLKPIRTRATFGRAILLHPWAQGRTLLEVGCGAGMYLDLMRALGWSVVGVDLGESGIEKARSVLGLEVYCGELEDAALDAERFGSREAVGHPKLRGVPGRGAGTKLASSRSSP